MDFGVSLPCVGPAAEREFMIGVARAAERLGFHSVWVSDHVLLPKERTSEYPYPRSTTEVGFTPGIAWLDPIAAMGVVAGATERVLVGSNVLVLPYRNPVVLANEVSTLDRLSEGRIVLGVGAGWMDEEFEAIGVPRAERGARTDEHIAVLRALWSSRDPVSFDGRFSRFRDVTIGALPHRPGGPPVMVGGNSGPALARAGRLGDGWLGFEVFPDEIPAARESIARAARAAGRDPSAIVVSARRALLPPFEVANFLPDRRAIGGDGDALGELRAYAEAGASLVVLDCSMLPGEIVATLEWFAAEVAPAAGDL